MAEYGWFFVGMARLSVLSTWNLQVGTYKFERRQALKPLELHPLKGPNSFFKCQHFQLKRGSIELSREQLERATRSHMELSRIAAQT